mmetsp:Transcript_22272/g.35832  ORF Transcript_22272/g.35832 Transcript_22272/m.35832 type:complete len:153 (+) Transcript_22272:158-616(+)
MLTCDMINLNWTKAEEEEEEEEKGPFCSKIGQIDFISFLSCPHAHGLEGLQDRAPLLCPFGHHRPRSRVLRRQCFVERMETASVMPKAPNVNGRIGDHLEHRDDRDGREEPQKPKLTGSEVTLLQERSRERARSRPSRTSGSQPLMRPALAI